MGHSDDNRHKNSDEATALRRSKRQKHQHQQTAIDTIAKMTNNNNNNQRRSIGGTDNTRCHADHSQTPTSSNTLTEPKRPTSEEQDLRLVAAEATVIEFDSRTGLPIHHRHYLPDGIFDPIRGLVKKRLSPSLFIKLQSIHRHIQEKVDVTSRVPWAGVNDNDPKVRAFGFVGPEALDRLDNHSSVRLAAPEKEGTDEFLEDEAANRKAICILNVKPNDSSLSSQQESSLDVMAVTKEIVAALDPQHCGLDPSIVCPEELIVYQINMHNGNRHLPAHLDWPLHEGFGKVIVTVAVRGNATVLLIDGVSTVIVGGEELQPAWRFHLEEGECYVLSDRVRNRCLHAVVADDDNKDRESLNLRFGLHSDEEAEQQITRYWQDKL